MAFQKLMTIFGLTNR